MTAPKSVRVRAALVKAEPVYNSGASMSFAGPDSVKLHVLPELTEEFAVDGVRGTPPGSMGTQRRTSPSGPSLTTTLAVELKGNGSGYSTVADRIPNQILWEAAGLSSSLAEGSWSFVYTADEDTPTSVGMELYARNELHQVSGAYADHSFTIDEGGPVVVEFAFQGTREAPVTDIARPTIIYPASQVVPPKATRLRGVLNFGGAFTPAMKDVAFAGNREIVVRKDLNSNTGHGGYDVSRRAPTFTMNTEAAALATFDPYALLRAGTNGTWDFFVGDAPSNSFEWNFAQCQIVDVVALGDENGATATYELTVQAYVSDEQLNDDFLFLAY